MRGGWIAIGLATLAMLVVIFWLRGDTFSRLLPRPPGKSQAPAPGWPAGDSSTNSLKDWPAHAVWYQIFPERFRNGDPKNDPTAEYSRVPEQVRAKWRITPWTKEWYGMDDWEKELAPDAYGTMHHRRYGGDFQGVMDKLDY